LGHELHLQVLFLLGQQRAQLPDENVVLAQRLGFGRRGRHAGRDANADQDLLHRNVAGVADDEREFGGLADLGRRRTDPLDAHGWLLPAGGIRRRDRRLDRLIVTDRSRSRNADGRGGGGVARRRFGGADRDRRSRLRRRRQGRRQGRRSGRGGRNRR